MKNIKLGTLLYGEGFSAPADLVDLAWKIDQLGYSKLWLGEHFEFDSYWCNPEVLLPLLLGVTNKLRVGTAGLPLNTHSPYRLALSFKMLNNLFSDRVDLGLNSSLRDINNPHPLLNTAGSVNPVEFYCRQKALVNCYKENEKGYSESTNAYQSGHIPEMWTLGTSKKRLDDALKLGTSFCGLMFNHGAKFELDKQDICAFKEAFFEQHNRVPAVNLVFAGVCHETESQATDTYRNSIYSKSPIIETNLVGHPGMFCDTILEYQETYGIDELMFLNLAPDNVTKTIGFELLSEALVSVESEMAG